MGNTIDGFSNFFTFAELTYSANHQGLVSQNRKDAVKYHNAGKRLSKLLESIRHILGDKPITVSSGYRNLLLNRAVGSKAKNSAHMKFEAADIHHIVMSTDEMFDRIIEAQKEGLLPDLRKAIREDHKGIIHVEVKMYADEQHYFYTTNDNEKFTLVVA